MNNRRSESYILLNQKTAITLGYWSAVFASVFAFLFVSIAIATSLMFPIKAWNGIQTYAENFNLLDMASFIPAFFLAPTMVILIACINAIAPMPININLIQSVWLIYRLGWRLFN